MGGENGSVVRIGERLRERIRSRMQARGWGMGDLADNAGVLHAQVRVLDQGYFVSASVVSKVLDALGIGREEWSD